MTKNITLRLYHTTFYFFEFAKIRVGDPVTSWIRILVPILVNIQLIDRKTKVLDTSDTKIKYFIRIIAEWNPQDLWTGIRSYHETFYHYLVRILVHISWGHHTKIYFNTFFVRFISIYIFFLLKDVRWILNEIWTRIRFSWRIRISNSGKNTGGHFPS